MFLHSACIGTNLLFTLVQDAFQLDGQNITLLSGSIHYHRVHPSLWRDRLARLRALGLNAVQTYVPWNWHQMHRGVVDMSTPARNISDFFAAAKGEALRHCAVSGTSTNNARHASSTSSLLMTHKESAHVNHESSNTGSPSP